MHHQAPPSLGGHAMPGADARTTRPLAISGWLAEIYFGIELGIAI